jgi:hypothetical protein
MRRVRFIFRRSQVTLVFALEAAAVPWPPPHAATKDCWRGDIVAGPSSTRRRIFLGTLGLLLVGGALAVGQELLRMSRHLPGDSKPIVLYADDIVTWSEQGQRTILLKGKVLVEHGLLNLRCQQAVAWVNEAHYQRTRIWQVEIYAEGEVRLENGPHAKTGPQAQVDLSTRGELRLKSQASKVVQQPRPNDPVLQRGLVHRPRPPDSAGPERWTPTSGAAGPSSPSGIQRTSYQEIAPAAAPPLPERPPNVPPVPPGTSPAGPPTPPTLLPPLPGTTPVPPAPAPAAVPPPAWGPPPGSPPGGIPPPPGPDNPPPEPAAPAPAPGASSGANPGLSPGAASGGPPRILSIAPRTGTAFNVQSFAMPNGEQAIVVTSGVILNVSNVEKVGLVDIEADRLVMWTRGNTQEVFEGMKRGGEQRRELEFFLSGNVVLRSGVPKEEASGKGRPRPTGNGASSAPAAPRPGAGGAEEVAPPPRRLDDGAAPKAPPRRSPQEASWDERSPLPKSTAAAADPLKLTPVDARGDHEVEYQVLYADQVYYDVNRNVAVAISADFEMKDTRLPTAIHLKADELYQLSPTQFKGVRATLFSSRLPSDPGLKVQVAEAQLELKPKQPKRSIFGVQFVDPEGELVTETKRQFHADDVVVRVNNVPILYFPALSGEANDPLGPLEDVRTGFDRIFGYRIGVGLDVYDLIAREPLPGTRWTLDFDYLTERGPALGMDFDYLLGNIWGVESKAQGLVRAWGIYDTGEDILGRFRNDQPHTPWRGRFTWRQNWQEMPYGFSIQHQVAWLSDKNFFEQFFKPEFDLDINQETFLYVKQQQDIWAWTFLAEPRIRNWVTEAEKFPELGGHLLGLSFFNLLTYNAHASMGYYRLLPTEVPPLPDQLPGNGIFLTDVRTETGRFDLWQELSLPFSLGPVRLAPYARVDLTQYTEDLNGEARGRFYGAGGLRASLPLSRLYPDVDSLYFNLNGLYHKIVLSGNFYVAHSDTPFTSLPQIDRLDDDATDQARRDFVPVEDLINPANGIFLQGLDPATALLFNPQFYAIRRLVDNRIDTLDDIEVLQMDLRQRWQTKRGYPGMQHIVDWMILDLSGSYFPQKDRDNFGEDFAFLEYDWLWNLGDRTALTSTGWVDPIEHGARVFTIGSYLNRPDRTNFYLGFRYIDPIQSRATTLAVTYIFSPKYAMTGSSTYDFGTRQALSNSLVFTRIGTDLTMSFGLTYNATVNTFGVQFQLVPNLLASQTRLGSAQRVFTGGNTPQNSASPF